jgi:hypothetical protein
VGLATHRLSGAVSHAAGRVSECTYYGNLTSMITGILQHRTDLTQIELGSGITGPASTHAGQPAVHHEDWQADWLPGAACVAAM